MADILQLLIDIFKISPQMVNQYAMVSPLEQIFYLFFFPTLFIIVLIFIVTRVITQHKGINLLIALALYAFIIFQGLYNWFVFLSKYWLFGLIFLAFIYLILGRLGQPGGARGKTLGEKGKAGKFLGFLEDVTGKKLNPKDVLKFGKMIERDIKRLIERKKVLEKRASELKHDPQAANFIYNQIAQVDQALTTLENFKRSGALDDYQDWRKANQQMLSL
jgi:hypothetical protein